MREESPRLALGRCRGAAAFCFCIMQEPPAGAVRARMEPRQGKCPQITRKAPRRALSRSGGFVSSSWSAAPGGCCTFKGFGMLPNKSALYKQKHCKQGFVRTKALLAASVMGLRRIACDVQFFTDSSRLDCQAASRGGGHSSRSVSDGRNVRLSSLRWWRDAQG